MHERWGASPSWTPEQVGVIAGWIIDLAVALPEDETMHVMLGERRPLGRAADDVVQVTEEVVAKIRKRHLELRLSPELFRPVLTAMEASDQALLAFARDGLYLELGIDTSPLHLDADEALIPNSFVVRVNDLDLLPHLALGVGELLVNDTPERLALQSVQARPTRNPATWQPGAIAPLGARQELEASGLTVWDRAGHATLAFAQDVRANAWRLLDLDTVSASLEPLTGVFPHTARTLDSLLSRTTLTRVLRGLLEERVSVRDFLSIAQNLIDSAERRGATRVDDLVEDVRTGLRWLVTSRASRGTDTIVCYLLDPHLERRVPATSLQDQGPIDQLNEALAQELMQLPATAQPPCILVAPEARRAIRLALAERFPNVAVVSFAELAPGVHVQPVARVGA